MALREMATIDIRRAHSLSDADARVKAEELARTMEQKLGLSWAWKGDAIEFEAASGPAKGTKGKVSLPPGEVRVEIDLPFLLKAMKSMIEDKVKTKLDSSLGKG